MMFSEFVGMMKLVSGEEIIGSVLVCEEENGFVVETPFTVDETIIETPAGEMVKVDLRPWIKFSAEEIIFIEKEKTITVYEADERIIKIYNRTLRKYLHNENDTSQMPLNEEMGFKTKVDDARSSLEKLFKDS
jgi:hypothetical protein|tara:strand:- start:2666 stop:3064 length:399 start_codon:yes stop_codon:yes gene_type:complete